MEGIAGPGGGSEMPCVMVVLIWERDL